MNYNEWNDKPGMEDRCGRLTDTILLLSAIGALVWILVIVFVVMVTHYS